MSKEKSSLSKKEIRIQVLDRLVDYKFNSTQIYTTEQQADMIIELVKEDVKSHISNARKRLKEKLNYECGRCTEYPTAIDIIELIFKEEFGEKLL
jgi:hypothetical protein